MKAFLIYLNCLLVIFSLVGCQGPAVIQPAAPVNWPTDGWRTSTPEQQGMDANKLADLFEAVQSEHIRLHSLLIVRNGYLVVEAYFPPYSPDIRHSIESNTKSVIGTLIGIAIDQGMIQNVNQRLVDFFPERVIANLDSSKKSITIANLLSMTPGLDCEDRTPAAEGMYQTRVWVQYLLDLPVVSKPGSKWVYCSGAAHLLSAVLQQATGMDARSYANQYLFQPLGVAPIDEKDWGSDPQGVTNGIAGLYLTPGELARYGFLYLNRGRWNGQQVVSEQWVAVSTRQQAYIGKDPYVNGLDRRFGYMFSIFPEQKYYGYLGMAGQELYVFPEKNMVVVFNASLAVGKEARLLDLVNNYIVPSIISDQPLPANRQADERLQSYLQAITEKKQPIPPLPQAALDISGKNYLIEQNSIAWQSMSFYFQPGSDEAVLRMDGSAQDLKIGLDNIFRFNEGPNSRPIGLRGVWKSPDEFFLEYAILGDFVEAEANIHFEADQIKIALTSLNFSSQPQILHGTLQRNE